MSYKALDNISATTQKNSERSGDIELEDVSRIANSRNRGNGTDYPEDDELNGPGHELLGHSSSRSSSPQKESTVFYTADEEKSVVRKLDKNLVLFLALLYMLSFLDRSNIGNARIAGLEKDLQLSSDQYEWVLTIFYVFYITFEWMTLLYRVFPPHIYISLCVLSWGLVASLQALAFSFHSMLVLRGLLGISEAAFGPGVPFFLSLFYKSEELALRVGMFISAAPLATSFASSLAWAITSLGEQSPIAPWRLLFLAEGFPSVIVAVFAWLQIPDRPKKARYLNRREKRVAEDRLKLGRSKHPSGSKKSLKFTEIFQALQDPKCYITALMFFSCNVAFSSLPVFLPTIIQEMGHTASSSQALSAPPYLVAFVVVLVTAYLSDRLRSRAIFVSFHGLLAATGYALIAFAGWLRLSPGLRYLGVYPATCGFFSAITIIISWTINMQQSDSKKGTATVILQLIGQCGPLLGTRLYPDEDKPFYIKGMFICSGFMLLVSFLSLALGVFLSRENRRLDLQAARSEARHRGNSAHEVSKEFRYLV